MRVYLTFGIKCDIHVICGFCQALMGTEVTKVIVILGSAKAVMITL